MNFNNYLNKRVQIILAVNNFTYIGFVVDVDDDSITIIDKNNSRVSLTQASIQFIKEVNN